MANAPQRNTSLPEAIAAQGLKWGRLLSAFPTPYLVVDGETARANCVIAAEQAERMGVTIRPHAKAHKCSRLLQVQLEKGNAQGVTCATIHEALKLADLGFDDLLIANELVSAAAEAMLAAVAGRARQVAVAVDSPRGVDVAAAAAVKAGRVIDVLIDIDVGSGRCGLVAEDQALLTIARLVEDQAGLRLRGLMGYTGKANYLENRVEREAVAYEVRRRVGLVADRLHAAGHRVTVTSGGSTGLWDIDQGLTEVQFGSYVLMEGRYATVGLPFDVAVYCVATVISRTRPGRLVLDTGWKALSAEFGLPSAPTGLTPLALSDEHLICEVAPGASYEVGDSVLLVPAHLDPTINLHDRLVVVHDDQVDLWDVDLRRVSQGADRSDAA